MIIISMLLLLIVLIFLGMPVGSLRIVGNVSP